MKQKKTLLAVLYTLSLAAILFYPVSKIIRFETSETFEEFKFKATVYDPYDPMRGRFVQLNIQPNRLKTRDTSPRFKYRDHGYIVFRKDKKGFARLQRLEKDRTSLRKGEYAIKVNRISHMADSYSRKKPKKYTYSYHFRWPFNRFYLNELKAPELEAELQKRNQGMTLKVRIFSNGDYTVSGLEK